MTRFAGPAEEAFAALLDKLEIRWEYEPHTFPLEEKDGKVTSAFCPDFWLPDLGLYVELTTMKSKLQTRKNRKMRLLTERYPDVRVVLLARDDLDLLSSLRS